MPPSGSLLESYFGLSRHGTDARTEVRAGVATFKRLRSARVVQFAFRHAR